MKRAKLSRRDTIGLAALAIGAAWVGRRLGGELAQGKDVSGIMDVPALQNAPGFPSEGPADARVKMLVFSDYACGVCRQTEPVWRDAVREAGDVRVIHRDWPILGEQSRRAARVALAAGRQGLYAPVHEILIRTGRHDEEALRQAVTVAGGDWARLQRDLVTDAEAIDRLLARTAQDALQLGFRGTPGYLIGPIRMEGGASQGQFKGAIERAREAGKA